MFLLPGHLPDLARTVVTLVGAGAYAFDPWPRAAGAEGPVGRGCGVANGGGRNARAGPAG